METTIEWCSACEEEVEIKVGVVSNCPFCGARIKPCSMCNLDERICSKCYLGD